MSRIFLSHSSKDNFEASALCEWLADEGWNDVFLDLDPWRGIAAGERWERALHQAAQRCEAVIFLVSRNWLASGWCRKEYELARGLNKRLFGVLIDRGVSIDDVPSEFTGTWQVVDLGPGLDGQIFRTTLPGSHEEQHVTYGRAGLRRLKRGLEKAGLDPGFFAWPPAGEATRAPYRGLKPLEAADAGIFFGRDAPIVEALDRLRGIGAGAPPRLLVILGASGAGKSSFLRAGLLPRLARDDRHFLTLPPVRPERAALSGETGLLGALETVIPGRGRAVLRTAIAAGAAGVRPLLAEWVQSAIARTLASESLQKPPTVVIAVDQAEEVFRAEGGGEGAALLDLLKELTASDEPAVIAIFVIRSDAYDALEHAKALEGVPQATLPLLPLPRSAYKEVIEGPARRMNESGGRLAVEPRLAQRLLDDIEQGGGSDALPLLAFTLEQLWLEYGRAGALRLADYEAFGGLKGAIDAAVKRAFIRADADARIPRDPAAREALLRRGLIPWLAGIDPDTKSSRRNIARRNDIPAEAAPLIDLLIEERLLATDTLASVDAVDRAAETGIATIEPAHEALLRQWGLLQDWLAEDFGLLAMLEGVKRAARDWDANLKAAAWLAHQGERLADTQKLDLRPDIAARLDSTDLAYLTQCRSREKVAREEAEQRHREREDERSRKIRDARRLARRTGLGFVVALVLAAVAGVFGLYAEREKTIADERSREARLQRSAADAAAADARAQKNTAENARNVADKREAEARFNQALALSALSTVALTTSPTRAVKLALAAWPRQRTDRTPKPDVTMLALGAATMQQRERRIFRGHERAIRSAAFSPDGTRVVTAADDRTARLWDASTGREIAVLRGHEGDVHSASFSPDGRLVVTASRDRTARLWDAVTGRQITVLIHDGAVASATFSPSGARVVTACDDRTARLWDTATGTRITIMRGHSGAINSAVVSPDGTRVVTASDDQTSRLWDAATGTQIATLRGHGDRVNSAVFSSDGVLVATASDDRTARLWDAWTGKEISILRGHDERVRNAVFSADGMQVVTASDDRTARNWDTKTGKEIAVLRGHLDDIGGASISPDGARIVTASSDKTARLWDAATGRQISVFRGHEDSLVGAAFSADGTRVVTASDDKTARLWDAATGVASTVILRSEERTFRSAAFSPDRTRIAMGSEGGTAWVWDAATGRIVAVFRGHSGLVKQITFSADSLRLVTASLDSTARVWDVATGRQTALLSGHKGAVLSAAFSSDGSRLVTASEDGTARIWDAATGRQTSVLVGHKGAVLGASFSPSTDRIVTASEDSTARIWDVETGRQIAVLRGHGERVTSAAFSTEGTRVLTASGDKTARLWDALTGHLVTVFRGHENAVESAVFSPDQSRVLTTSRDATARLWSASTGSAITLLRGRAHPIFGLGLTAVFSPDGSRVLTTSSGNIAQLWDAATGLSIAVLRGHAGLILNAAFAPDGTQVSTVASDSVEYIWNLGAIPKGDVFKIACAWLPDHELTDIARDYGLNLLEPICRGDPPLPDHLPK